MSDPVVTLSVAIADLQGSLKSCVEAFQQVTTRVGTGADSDSSIAATATTGPLEAEVAQLRAQNAAQASRIRELEALVGSLRADRDDAFGFDLDATVSKPTSSAGSAARAAGRPQLPPPQTDSPKVRGTGLLHAWEQFSPTPAL